jgi:hypothetical protein
MVSGVPEVTTLNLLKNGDDFLMHGVVLQNRLVAAPPAPHLRKHHRNRYRRGCTQEEQAP